jgi:hypothetical protein
LTQHGSRRLFARLSYRRGSAYRLESRRETPQLLLNVGKFAQIRVRGGVYLIELSSSTTLITHHHEIHFSALPVLCAVFAILSAFVLDL